MVGMIGSGGQFGLNRLFYVMHVITTFLHELIFVSKIGATMSTFILSTFVSIALWHVMDGGFSINFFGFGFSTEDNNLFNHNLIPHS